ncbi:MAG: magnesium transporter CorA family protein [Candidatus Magasanikbacteria bacterium]|nr:magnesium transporter CorA family protein [Candidatus Magasanikbacteria bacterium]
MPGKILTEGKVTWSFIEEATPEILAELKSVYKFHQLDLDDVGSDSTHIPKVDVYKNYLFLVLHVPEWSSSEKKITIGQVSFFIGENYVISISHRGNKSIRGLFFRCLKNRGLRQEWMSGSSGLLLYHILAAMFQEARPLLNNIGKHVALVEDEVFSGEPNTKLIKELAGHRRNILLYRNIIDPQRYVITSLSNMRRPYLEENLTIYFDDIRDYLDKLWAIIETYKETVNGLYMTVESIINQRTNKILLVLTVVSASFLPHTLLFNMYGMNLPNLPLADHANFVWGVFGTLTVAVITALLFLMRRMKKTGWF